MPYRLDLILKSGFRIFMTSFPTGVESRCAKTDRMVLPYNETPLLTAESRWATETLENLECNFIQSESCDERFLHANYVSDLLPNNLLQLKLLAGQFATLLFDKFAKRVVLVFFKDGQVMSTFEGNTVQDAFNALNVTSTV